MSVVFLVPSVCLPACMGKVVRVLPTLMRYDDRLAHDVNQLAEGEIKKAK